MPVSKKKSPKKVTTKKVEKVETCIVEEVKPEIQGYVVPVFFKREPIEKDIHVADLFYRKNSNTVDLETRMPNHEAKIEMIIEGDISVTNTAGSTKMVSKSITPKDWLINLPNSNEFSGNPYIAYEVIELYEA
mgnify:FL=1